MVDFAWETLNGRLYAEDFIRTTLHGRLYMDHILVCCELLSGLLDKGQDILHIAFQSVPVKWYSSISNLDIPKNSSNFTRIVVVELFVSLATKT